MADDLDTSTVADDASTSVTAEPVEGEETEASKETEPEVKEPATADEVWDFSDVKDEEPEPEKETDKPDEKSEDEKPEEKQEEKKEKDDEKSLEDEVLEEAFSDGSEKKPDESEEDLSKMSKEEKFERQRNKFAREWAERNATKAEVVKDFEHDTPIAEVATKFEKLNKDRYTEFSQFAAHQLVDANPQETFNRAYAVKMLQKDPNTDLSKIEYPSLDDLIANGGAAATPGATTKTAKASVPAELKDATAELDSTLGWDWRDPNLDENFVDERELAMAKAVRALEAKAQESTSQNAELNEKLKGLTEGHETIENQEIKAELMRTVGSYRDEIDKKVLPWIAKNTGLEVTSEDTPEIKTFKDAQMELYKGTEYERANNLPSAFESFAYNESSVRNELETIAQRVVKAQVQEVQAKRAGDKANEDKFHREAADELVPIFQLLGQANKEFKAKRINPVMALIGKLSTKLAKPIKEASERKEVVSNGQPAATRQRKKEYATADAVWDGMVEDAARDEKLRAGA